MPNIELTGDRLAARVTIGGSVEAVWRELTKNNGKLGFVLPARTWVEHWPM